MRPTEGGAAMDVDQFVDWLRTRDRGDIDRVVAALDATCDTADGQVGRLRGGRVVARELRRRGRCQQGCRAAHTAIEAAVEVCEITGLRDDDRAAATRLARAAGEAARALVAGVDSGDAHVLLRPFFGAATMGAFSPS